MWPLLCGLHVSEEVEDGGEGLRLHVQEDVALGVAQQLRLPPAAEELGQPAARDEAQRLALDVLEDLDDAQDALGLGLLDARPDPHLAAAEAGCRFFEA